MKTIEERSKEYREEFLKSFYNSLEEISFYDISDAYIKGATEQKAIDDEEYRKDMRYIGVKREELIEKACNVYANELKQIVDLLNKHGIYDLEEILSFEGCVNDFREAMEDQI